MSGSRHPRSGPPAGPAPATEPPGEPEPRARRRPPGWARVALALVAFAATAFSPFLAYLIPPLRDALTSGDPVPALSAQAVASLIPLAFYILFTAVLTRYADHRPLRAAGLTLNRRAVTALLAGTGLAVLIIVCLAVVFYALGIGGAPGLRRPDPTAGGAPVWLVLVFILSKCYALQGIGEEALMRGYLLQSFSDRPGRAVWISTLAFTSLHLISQGGQQNVADHVFYLATPFGFALAAAYLSLVMRSVWAGIGIHGGLHLGSRIVQMVGLNISGPIAWIATGVIFGVVGLVIASRISKQRWAEIAARGPYAPPTDR